VLIDKPVREPSSHQKPEQDMLKRGLGGEAIHLPPEVLPSVECNAYEIAAVTNLHLPPDAERSVKAAE
jgi:hypothetical protein